jgi:glucosamine--fructose-6-phosphate aminotransferase (isomerizing)
MTSPPTHMRREIEEIPAMVRHLLGDADGALRAAGEWLRRNDPAIILTVARGSSDHAASYLKYAIELSTGIPVASLGPSIVSIYQTRLKPARAVCLAVSQSGQSPDIVALADALRAGGAATLAFTNVTASPLAAAADRVIDLKAGPEKSVAATKSFVASIVAGLAVLAYWREDAALIAALSALPEQLERALGCDWSVLSEALGQSNSVFILGRGPANAIASEVALKFKETCGIHAEAYSAAEVLHGPAAIIRQGFPVIALAARDAAEEAIAATVTRLVDQGANAFITSGKAKGAQILPFVATGHPLTDPLVPVASFYAFIEGFARARGRDPDSPPHLRKVTETR